MHRVGLKVNYDPGPDELLDELLLSPSTDGASEDMQINDASDFSTEWYWRYQL